MAIINYFKKEINVKIVYCGPGLSGKTTNLQWLNQNLQEEKVGKLISLATKTDRTLFFDLMAVSLGKIRGFDARIQLFTTPGQVFYNATRKLVLKGVDGLVFVADSQEPMASANVESLANLRENLAEYGRNIDDLPLVFQYNKRDLNNVLSIQALEEALNPGGLPYYESSAVTGQGVMKTFQEISKRTFASLKEIHDIENRPGRSPAPEPVPPIVEEMAKTPVATSPSSPTVSASARGIKRSLPPTLGPDGTLHLPIVLDTGEAGKEVEFVLQIKIVAPPYDALKSRKPGPKFE